MVEGDAVYVVEIVVQINLWFYKGNAAALDFMNAVQRINVDLRTAFLFFWEDVQSHQKPPSVELLESVGVNGVCPRALFERLVRDFKDLLVENMFL